MAKQEKQQRRREKATKQENEKKTSKHESGKEAPNPNLKPSYPFDTRPRDARPCGTHWYALITACTHLIPR